VSEQRQETGTGSITTFVWHPLYQGQDVEHVRRTIIDELGRDQRQYELALQIAEQNESASLQSIVTLDQRWSPFDLGWAEADVPALADFVVDIELAREQRREMTPVAALRGQVVAPPDPLPAADTDDGGTTFALPRGLVIAVAAIIALLAILILALSF